MKNYFDIKDKVAVVTGASSGLGWQIAQAYASQGAKLALFARREERLLENVAEIEKMQRYIKTEAKYKLDKRTEKYLDDTVEAFNKKIDKVKLHIPVLNNYIGTLDMYKIDTRFCSFGLNWNNKNSKEIFVGETFFNNGYESIDITSQIVDKDSKPEFSFKYKLKSIFG